MQLLAFAVILWAMWLRSWPTLAILLSLAMAMMAGPLCFNTKNIPIVSLSILIPISAAISLFGIVLCGTAYYRWLRGNWV
jgi:hypothetical protein